MRVCWLELGNLIRSHSSLFSLLGWLLGFFAMVRWSWCIGIVVAGRIGWRWSVVGRWCWVVCLVDWFFPLHHQYPLFLVFASLGLLALASRSSPVYHHFFFLLFHIVTITIIIISWVMLYCQL